MTRRSATASLAAVLGLLTGCGGGNSPTASTATATTVGTTEVSARQQDGDAVRITIDVEDATVTGTLNGSAAARDLTARLPVTVTMSDHGGVEKTGPLPSPLSTGGSPDGADPVPGDIGYYAPTENFVLYYGDQSYFPGIVILGAMDPSSIDVVGSLGETTTVIVSAA